MAQMQDLKSETAPLVGGEQTLGFVAKNKKFLLLGAGAATLAVIGVVVGVFLVTGSKDKDDVIVFNANVYTVDPDMPTAEAFSVRNGRIKEVNTKDELVRKYKKAKLVDAGGAFVMPGFTDAHGHLLNLGSSMLQVELYNTSSVEEAVDRMVAFIEEHGVEEGAFLLGRGWNQNDWGNDMPFPTRWDIDPQIPDIPVWVRRVDGHSAWGNSAALALAEIPDEDPPGGTIVRNEAGEPTGVFRNLAMAIIDVVVPPATDAFRRQALALAISTLHSVGITGVHDAGVSPTDVEFFKLAVDEDRFNVREYAMLACPDRTFCGDTLEQLHHYGDRLTLRSTKMYMDGALGSWSAAMLEPYYDRPNETGLIITPREEYEEMVDSWLAHGWQVNTHGIGDRGNRIIIDVMEEMIARDQERGGLGPGGRHRIEHAQIMSLDDIPRLRGLGILPSMQPTHATSDMGMVPDRLGPPEFSDRILGAYAWQTMLSEATDILPLGSDFPVEFPNPMLGVYASITRQDASGMPEGGWFPDQRLSREQTLKGFTQDAAYAAFAEEAEGSITAGKFADFIILDTDLMTASPQEILRAKVLATFFEGLKVFGEGYDPVEQ